MKPGTALYEEIAEQFADYDESAMPKPELIAPPQSRVGKLTAEAMKKEYESASEAIENLGDMLLSLKARMDKETEAIMEMIDGVNALAKRYREEGARISATVDDCSKQTQRVREICADLALPRDKQ